MNGRTIHVFLCLLLLTAIPALAQTAGDATLEKGANFIETKVYSQEENAEILKLYEGLRVSDVTDGMDAVGLPGVGLVDPAIHPDWVDREKLSHVIRGIAVTARYVPTQRPNRPAPGEDFTKWENKFYAKYSSEIFSQIIKPGNVLVIDEADEADVGSIGSNNILGLRKLGAVGVVVDAGLRDTDEIAIEKVPIYLRTKGRGIRPGRNELESVNRPVSIGGVLVCPGDVVVADGDGVIVVPRAVAKEVAEQARKILELDKAVRRSLYKSLGIPPDKTVE